MQHQLSYKLPNLYTFIEVFSKSSLRQNEDIQGGGAQQQLQKLVSDCWKRVNYFFRLVFPGFGKISRQAMQRNIKEHAGCTEKYQRRLTATIYLLAIQKGLLGRSFPSTAASCSWQLSPAQAVWGSRYCLVPQESRSLWLGTCTRLSRSAFLQGTSAQIQLHLRFRLWAGAAGEQVEYVVGLPWGLLSPSPEMGPSLGMSRSEVSQGSSEQWNSINTSGFQHWKAHKQEPWAFTARIPAIWLNLTFTGKKMKKSHTICSKIFKAGTFGRNSF